jgi:hypothetical protein
MAEFSADDISGPVSMTGTANFYFAVALPDGSEGHAVVGTQDAFDNSVEEPARFQRVAAALNFHAQGHSCDDVVGWLNSPDGFSISLTGF